MDINIKVEIEGLDQLTEAFALIGSAMAYKNGMVKTSSEAVDLMLDVTDKVEDLTGEEKIKKEIIKEVVTEAVKEKKTEVEEKAPVVTIEKVREIFMDKNSKQNTPKLKQILKDHGVSKVTDLEEKDFPSVLKALGEI